VGTLQHLPPTFLTDDAAGSRQIVQCSKEIKILSWIYFIIYCIFRIFFTICVSMLLDGATFRMYVLTIFGCVLPLGTLREAEKNPCTHYARENQKWRHGRETCEKRPFTFKGTFTTLLACQKSFYQNTNLGVKSSPFREIWGQNWNIGHHNLYSQKCLAVCQKTATVCTHTLLPATPLATRETGVHRISSLLTDCTRAASRSRPDMTSSHWLYWKPTLLFALYRKFCRVAKPPSRMRDFISD